MRKSIWQQLEAADGWERYLRWTFSRVKLVDGTTTRSPYLMRRRGPDGSWQYRRMTEEEFGQAIQ
jgi:hypothetical protein